MKKAFTMAEVLVTLGVIGIVASMTLPIIIEKQQQLHTVQNLKKFYSVMHQAVLNSQLDNGPIEYWTIGDPAEGEQYASSDTSREFFDLYLRKYLQIATDCDTGFKCFSDGSTQPNGNVAMNLNTMPNTVKYSLMGGYSIAILAEGKLVHIYVDLNAFKRPNVRGRDIFEFVIKLDDPYKKFFYPKGAEAPLDDTTEENPTCSWSYGYTCAAKIMTDQWQILSDYPW